ncbi:MAG TPA: SDR family NAD(P)-dependent oxidoreductase [bacterium]
MKTALITGSTRGIGLEIAQQLAQRRFRVWLCGRDEAAGRKAAAALCERNLDARFVSMDVSQTGSIHAAFQTLLQSADALDVLVNNAGISLDEADNILTVAPDILSQTMSTNAFGCLYVTQAAAPLLRHGGRVINVSSGAGQICRGMSAYAPVYSISKTTMNAITCQLAIALKPKGVTVNAVNPGWVRTDMGGTMAPRSVEKGAETPVWLATEAPPDQTGLFWHDKKIIPW